MHTASKALRTALAANASFSAACGLVMLMAPDQIDAWLGFGQPGALQVLGFGLLLFATDLIHQATRPRLLTWRALYASGADLLWVVATAVLLLIFRESVSATAMLALLAVAAVVLVFGIWQLWGIGKVHRTGKESRYRHCVSVTTDVPADAMWKVIGRLGEIERYMPSLRSSALLDNQTQGVGAIRVCEDQAGKRWREACTRFEPGRGFDVRFLTEAAAFPFPASEMLGGWDVIPRHQGSEVRVWWELTPKPKALAVLLLPILAFGADRDFPKVVARMASAAKGQPLEDARAEAPAITARLSASPCRRLAIR